MSFGYSLFENPALLFRISSSHADATAPKVPSSASSESVLTEAPSETDEGAEDPPFDPRQHPSHEDSEAKATPKRESFHIALFGTRNNLKFGTLDNFVGLIIDDLPVLPAGYHEPYLQPYLDLPVLRKLDWQTDEEGQAIRKELFGIRPAFIQTRGTLANYHATGARRDGASGDLASWTWTPRVQAKGPLMESVATAAILVTGVAFTVSLFIVHTCWLVLTR
jgi:hypothetical protein